MAVLFSIILLIELRWWLIVCNDKLGKKRSLRFYQQAQVQCTQLTFYKQFLYCTKWHVRAKIIIIQCRFKCALKPDLSDGATCKKDYIRNILNKCKSVIALQSPPIQKLAYKIVCCWNVPLWMSISSSGFSSSYLWLSRSPSLSCWLFLWPCRLLVFAPGQPCPAYSRLCQECPQ